MTVAEIDQKLTELNEQYMENADAILAADRLKASQPALRKQIAALHKERAKAAIAELRAGK